MKTSANTLPTDVETLQELVLKLQSQVSTKQNKLDTLQSKYQYLLEQFRLAQHQQFGRSNEENATQGDLFNEAEALFGDFIEPEKESISYTRNKPKRKPLPKDLPREVIVHDINEADKVCDCCGNDLHQMGEDKSEQLQFVPAQIKVIEHIRLKYSCRTCEQSATKTTLKIAPVPAGPPKSAVGKAIAYNLNQWQKLVLYVENGDLNIDNNRAERAIKPFVIGRKNWLFSNSASGANASAVLYSVIETAKANGLTPFNYLMHLLEELPKDPDDLEPLLPWNVELEQKI